MERVAGPVAGYYIVTYACEQANAPGRYVGYARVCEAQHEDYWSAPIAFDVTTAHATANEDEAHSAAHALALSSITLQKMRAAATSPLPAG
jgi:hypothetical protein